MNDNLSIPEAARLFLHQFETHLDSDLRSLNVHSELINASSYAMHSGGKRVRPLLVFALSEAAATHYPLVPVMEAALSVEYFHTASLIVDDLPCMDNDDFRRGMPTLHRKFDQTTAILTSYGLICRAFEMIHRSGLTYEKTTGNPAQERVTLALQIAAGAAGFEGATGGQYLDIFEGAKTLENYFDLSNRKTASLFEVSFCFGWIFGGGDLSEVEEVAKIAKRFGLAFQAIDDFDDVGQDLITNPTRNLFHLLSKDDAVAFIRDMRADYLSTANSYLKKSPTLSYLSSKIKEKPADELLKT